MKISPRAPQWRWLKLLHSAVGARNLLGGQGVISASISHFALPWVPVRSRSSADRARALKSEEIVSCKAKVMTSWTLWTERRENTINWQKLTSDEVLTMRNRFVACNGVEVFHHFHMFVSEFMQIKYDAFKSQIQNCFVRATELAQKTNTHSIDCWWNYLNVSRRAQP